MSRLLLRVLPMQSRQLLVLRWLARLLNRLHVQINSALLPICPVSRQSFIQEGLELVRSALRTADGETHLFVHPRCEQLIRSYDPCISCATHFLKLTREDLTSTRATTS